MATQMQGLKTCFLAVGYAAWACVVALRSSASTTAAGAVQGLWPGWRSPLAWGILLYSAVGPGAIADVLQSVGQSSVTPAEASTVRWWRVAFSHEEATRVEQHHVSDDGAAAYLPRYVVFISATVIRVCHTKV